MLRLIENRQLVHILVLFMIVQFGGLLVASLVFSTTPPVVITSSSETVSTSQVIEYFGYIVLATLVILLVFKVYHGNLLFILLEAYVVGVSSFFVFAIVISYLLPALAANYVYLLSIVLALALIIAKNKRPRLRNVATVFASIGVGVVLGFIFSIYIAYLFMLIIAIYDYVAVFVTKHMVTLANALSTRNLAFLIGTADVELLPPSYLKKKEMRDYAKYKSELKKSGNPILLKLLKSNKYPIVSQIQLGAGDLGIPLMVAVSAYTVFFNYFLSVMVIIGAAFGLTATMVFLRIYKKPLPAIPPLFSFVSIFLGIGILAKIGSNVAAYVFILIGAVAFLVTMMLETRKVK